MQIPYSTLYERVQEILKNKVEEFHYYGYRSITTQDLWRYCIDKLWRKQDVENLKLHELTSGIFRVSASQVLSYLQINDLKKPNLQVKLTEEEMNELFNRK